MNRPPAAARVSITDRCDLACVYCRPANGDACLPRERRLDVSAWAELFKALAAQGVRRLKLTGGEPLLHPHVVELVRTAANTPGITDVSLTTNATRLESLAQPLRDAGLSRINISVDSLREDRFRVITRGGELVQVLRGVRAACAAGFDEIKTNTVVLGPGERGDDRNDDELSDIVTWAWSLGITPRFIELMPIGVAAQFPGRLVSYRQMRDALVCLLGTNDEIGKVDDNRGPARYVSASQNRASRVGFITGTTRPFCEGCDRIRITADGQVRSCLARMDCVDVSDAARAGDFADLVQSLHTAWTQKPDTRSWKGSTETSARRVSMRVLGG
ncbi:MAG: radical SAM protein [Polyangiaceae bacterium]|nr:radical SAM protein [Polyangiaceae bacterium]